MRPIRSRRPMMQCILVYSENPLISYCRKLSGLDSSTVGGLRIFSIFLFYGLKELRNSFRASKFGGPKYQGLKSHEISRMPVVIKGTKNSLHMVTY